MIEKFDTDDENESLDKNLRRKNKKHKKLTRKVIIILILLVIIMIFILFLFIFKEKLFIQSHIYYIVLVGDIGGIHSKLRLLNMTTDINIEPIILKSSIELTVEYESLEILLKKFLSNIKEDQKPEYALMGMPGPVENNHIIILPNIPHWKVDDSGNELAKKLGMKKLIFINDFVGNGYAVQTKLKENIDYVILNKVQPKENGAKLVIGPGTGLGMGFLLKNEEDEYYTIGSSEGGGRDYSPKNEFYLKLRAFIKEEYKIENVSLDKMCSSRSLVPIYKFLNLYGNRKYKREPQLAKKVDEFKDYNKVGKISEINAEIIDKGLKEECELSKATLLLFIEIFGEIAGDLALFTLPYNGVYLTGRLTRKLTPLILNNTIFMSHFKNKDHFWFLLERIPVYLIQNKNIELIGVTEAIRRFLEEEEQSKKFSLFNFK